jgi:hypothetical protein
MLPGALISLLTFPGVIVHEWAHKKFCEWFGVKVLEVKYYKFNNILSFESKPAGYVIHEEPTNFKQTFWISVGPLVLNSLICLAIGFFAPLSETGGWPHFFMIWLAISIGAHAFPSDHDAKAVLQRSRHHIKNEGSALHYLSYPFFILIWLANKLSFIWFDFFYAIILLQFVGAF